MNIFGLQITRAASNQAKTLSRPDSRGGWWPFGRESFAGAWQRNIEIRQDSVLSFHAVFACQTLIASDIAKLRVKLVQQDADGVWTETRNPAYSPVLRKPNGYQNRIQFLEGWVISKLSRGNTYVLKVRDGRGVVVQMHVLNPDLVTPLVSDDGQVFYELNADNLSGVGRKVTVPAREIIHDRFNCLFHPLVGLSPIFANGLGATQGLEIQKTSARFFANNSQPGGVLTAPGTIGIETAARLKADWTENYSGKNAGKVAVLGDGLKYESMAVTADDAQLIEQLKWSAEVVCSTYHVPPYKIGVGALPSFNNVQSLNVEYYSQCLQVLIESIELCLDEGLGTGETLGTELDVDNLLRMDSVTQMEVATKGIGGVLKPDEARARIGLVKVEGGDAVYLQQQNFSLPALAKRDAQDDPFRTAPSASAPAAPAQSETPAAANDDAAAGQAREALYAIMKGFS